MTTEEAIIALADRAASTASTPEDLLSVYQAISIAFAGVCTERSDAALRTVKALLAAEEAQMQFRELLRRPTPSQLSADEPAYSVDESTGARGTITSSIERGQITIPAEVAR